MKIGQIVRNSIPAILEYCETQDRAEIARLQDPRYSKVTFDITIHSASPWRQLAKQNVSGTGHGSMLFEASPFASQVNGSTRRRAIACNCSINTSNSIKSKYPCYPTPLQKMKQKRVFPALREVASKATPSGMRKMPWSETY